MTKIFVFGSNKSGIHGAGSALHAKRHYGAKYGIGVGRTGNSYAIPTKDANLQVLPLSEIEIYVKGFLIYATNHPELTFDVVPIGCGLAGYEAKDIAPMFRGHTSNVNLPKCFLDIIG